MPHLELKQGPTSFLVFARDKLGNICHSDLEREFLLAPIHEFSVIALGALIAPLRVPSREISTSTKIQKVAGTHGVGSDEIKAGRQSTGRSMQNL
jgi:hypothetical protein